MCTTAIRTLPICSRLLLIQLARSRFNNQVSVFRSSCVDMYNHGNYIASTVRICPSGRPGRPGNEVSTFYFVFQSQLIGTDCYLWSEPKGARRRWRKQTFAYSIAHSYMFLFALGQSFLRLRTLVSNIKHTEGIHC